MRTSKKIPIAMTLAALFCATGALGGDEYLVEQKGKEFVYKGEKITTLKIKVGDVVEFRNEDPYFHNVFSLSNAKLFDLGSYAQGKSKSVKFDKPGKVEIECAIHPQMHMIIEVK
ncbi:MAG: methylamine utilization protein [Candidatus Acidiferrum sp.]